MLKITYIIVTYNSQDLIRDAIQSIYDFSDINPSDFEVIIVDNSNNEMHQILLKEISDLKSLYNIIIIHNIKNGGYGQGNNIGIKAAKGKIISIMNPDVRLIEPLAKDVLHKFNSMHLGVLGYNQMGGGDYSFYIKPECRGFLSGWKMKLLNKINLFSETKHYLSGAFFFADKQKFEEIGFFDENIFLYFEEPDISNRMIKAGYSINYDQSKKYVHLVGDRISYSDFGFRNEMKSLSYYLKKYNIDEAKFLKTFLKEYSIKLKVAKLLSNKERVQKFIEEIKVIKEVFKT